MKPAIITLQKLNKVAKILCKIIFWFSVIGCIGSLIGAVSLMCINGELEVDGVNLLSKIEQEASVSRPELVATCLGSAIICGVEVYLCRIAYQVFHKASTCTTPFNFDLAKEFRILGLKCIIVTIATSIALTLCAFIVMACYGSSLDSVDLSYAGSITVGIAFLILSAILRCGAESMPKSESSGDVFE